MKTFKTGPKIATPNRPAPGVQVNVTVRLVPDVKTALDLAAKKTGVSRNRLINEILAEKLSLDFTAEL